MGHSFCFWQLMEPHTAQKSVSALWAAADTSSSHPSDTPLAELVGVHGSQPKKKKETHRNCVLSWGEVGLRKSNTADVGGKNNYFFLGLLLTACFFFPAFPLHSEAGIVYAHVNVCIMLNS